MISLNGPTKARNSTLNLLSTINGSVSKEFEDQLLQSSTLLIYREFKSKFNPDITGEWYLIDTIKKYVSFYYWNRTNDILMFLESFIKDWIKSPEGDSFAEALCSDIKLYTNNMGSLTR